MARDIQMVLYSGFLAADPETAFTKSSKEVTNFRMGSNRSYKAADGTDVKETTWLKVTCWGKLGEIVSQYCKKGSHVLVMGTLRVGKNGSPTPYKLSSGDWAASYEITASEVHFLGKNGNQVSEESPSNEEVGDEEIPF